MAEEIITGDWEERAKRRVLSDFKRAQEFLDPIHKTWLSNYEHYRAGQTTQGIHERKSDNLFPVPFTTEQVDTFCSMINDKLFHMGAPATIYPREDTDKADAEAKQAMFDYHDEIDDVEMKIRMGTKDGALYGIIPFKVDYQERQRSEVINSPRPVPDETGQPMMDMGGQPVTVDVPEVVETPEFLGAAVTKLDPFDTFFVPEKVCYGDGHAIMVRTRMRRNEFTAPYFFNIEKIKKKDGAGTPSGTDDILKERRHIAGQKVDNKYFQNHCVYIEWQGYYDPGDEVDGIDGQKMEPGHYVIGVVTGTIYEDTLVRFDKDPLKLGKENIIIGNIERDDGSLIGYALIDKFHALQHAQDTICGMLIANLKQQVKRPKIVCSEALIDPSQINTAIDETIEVHETEDVTKVIHFPDVPNMSPDIYNGLQIFRQMGQNSTRLYDIAQGKVQEGVGTLGEGQILMGATNLSINDYLKTIEGSLIKPLYQMRNTINSYFLDVPYVVRVVGAKGLEWRQIEPGQVRASVDFVCEASSRDMERGVVTQQILQSIAPLMQVTQMLQLQGLPPARPDILMGKLYEQWSWSQDQIKSILPSLTIDDQQAQVLQQMMQQQQAMAAQAQGGGEQGPQPRNEQELQASMQGRNQTQVGRM